MIKGALIFGKERTERWLETYEIDIRCMNCGEYVTDGDAVYYTEDKKDIYCSKECLCGKAYGGTIHKKDYPNIWWPHLTVANNQITAWKCVLSIIKKGDKNKK